MTKAPLAFPRTPEGVFPRAPLPNEQVCVAGQYHGDRLDVTFPVGYRVGSYDIRQRPARSQSKAQVERAGAREQSFTRLAHRANAPHTVDGGERGLVPLVPPGRPLGRRTPGGTRAAPMPICPDTFRRGEQTIEQPTPNRTEEKNKVCSALRDPLGGPRVRMTFTTGERRGFLRRWNETTITDTYWNMDLALDVYQDMMIWVMARAGQRRISEPVIVELRESL